MKPGNYAWSEAELKTLISMRRENRSFVEISDVLGRSYDAVTGKASNIRSLIQLSEPKAQRASTAPRKQTRAEAFTGRLMGDPPLGRSALDQGSTSP